MNWKISFLLCLTLGVRGPASGSQAYTDSLRMLLETTDGSQKGDVYRKLANHYYSTDSNSQAYEYIQMAISEYSEAGDYLGVARANSLLGYIYVVWDNYERGLQAFLSAESIGRELKDQDIRIIALHGMARIYSYLGNANKALEVNRQGMALARAEGLEDKVNGFRNNAASIFGTMGQNDSALFYLNQYLDYSQKTGDVRSTVYALNNIGELYIKLNEYSLAMHYLEASDQANASLQDGQARAAVLGNMALIFRERGEYEKAIEYLERSNRISVDMGMKRFILENHKTISEVYALMGDHERALSNLSKYIKLKDEMFSEERQRDINELIRGYEMAELKRQDELFMQKHRNQRTLLILSVVVMVLAFVVIVLLINAYRLRIRLHKKKSRELSEVVDKRNRELTSALMHNSQMREVFQQFGSIVAQIEQEPGFNPEVAKRILELKKMLHASEGTEEDWETIQLHFNEVHPDFFRRLKAMCDDLTQHDLKHAAYIRMNLSTKEIARIMNVSERSVQTARYRIKKKLSIDKDTDLSRVLRDL